MKNQSKKTRNIILVISIIIGLIANYEFYNNFTCLIFLSSGECNNEFLLSWPIIIQYLLIMIVVANIFFLVKPLKKIKYFFVCKDEGKYYYRTEGIIFSLTLGFILNIAFILTFNILSYCGISVYLNYLISIVSIYTLLVSIIFGIYEEFDLDIKFEIRKKY